ncbi:MAG: hypothetical protein WC823_02620 [Parcubacteria group bacterium]
MPLCDAAALAEAIKQLAADVNIRRQMDESGGYFIIAANLRLIAMWKTCPGYMSKFECGFPNLLRTDEVRL